MGSAKLTYVCPWPKCNQEFVVEKRTVDLPIKRLVKGLKIKCPYCGNFLKNDSYIGVKGL